MAEMAFFDSVALRRRIKVHELHQAGIDVEDIAISMQITKRMVRYWLGLPKPKLQSPSWDKQWTEKAACNAEDTNLFFPELTGSQEKVKDRAKEICGMCPVIDRCRRDALANYETQGIWAGEDFSKFRYRYNDSTGDVFVETVGVDGSLKKIS